MEEENIKNYLKKVQQEKGLTLNKFAEELEINPSVLSRILSGTTPSANTLIKIAGKLNLGNIENLHKRAQEQSKVGFEVNSIKLGISFTIAASGILSLIKNSNLPDTVSVTFCEDVNNNPIFLKETDDLKQIDSENLFNYYYDEDIKKMLNSSILDCIIIPNKAQIFDNNIIEVAKIIEGLNVCMYVFSNKNSDQDTFKSPNITNFFDSLRECEFEIAYLPNTRNEINTLLNLDYIKESLPNLSSNIVEFNSNLVDNINFNLNSKPTYKWILIGFEPILNNFSAQYFNSDQINYQRINLSELLNKKSEFSLYTNKSILENTFKLKKIIELIQKLDNEKFETKTIDIFNSQLSKIFFTDSKMPEFAKTSMDLLNTSLKEFNFEITYKYTQDFIEFLMDKINIKRVF